MLGAPSWPRDAHVAPFRPASLPCRSYDADDEEEQAAALAAAAKAAQQQEKAAPAALQAAAQAAPVVAAAPVPAEKAEVVAKEAKQAADAEKDEEAKQAARSGVVLGAAAAPVAKKAQPEIKISSQVGAVTVCWAVSVGVFWSSRDAGLLARGVGTRGACRPMLPALPALHAPQPALSLLPPQRHRPRRQWAA